MKKKLVYPQNNRFELTVSSTDCNYIPKVKDAGKLIKGNPTLQLMHNGIKVIAHSYVGEWMTEAIRLLKGHHEPQEEKMFHQILDYMPEGGSMIELGSNWAYYSMWFNKKVKSAINIMVEPERHYLELGKKHFKLNKLKGTFLQGTIGASHTINNPYTLEDGSKITIPQFSVDQLLSTHKIKNLNILHSDIQGWELDMLKGARLSLSQKKIDFLVISTHWDRHYKCWMMLRRYGYYIVASHNVAESATADGLIVATRFSNMKFDNHFTGLRSLNFKQRIFLVYEIVKSFSQVIFSEIRYYLTAAK